MGILDLVDSSKLGPETLKQQSQGLPDSPSTHLLPHLENSAERLSAPDLDHPAHQLREQMLHKMDRSAESIVGELDQLIGQIEQIKNTVLRRTAALKEATHEHFDLALEVVGWKEQVARRLLDWVNGEATNGQEG